MSAALRCLLGRATSFAAVARTTERHGKSCITSVQNQIRSYYNKRSPDVNKLDLSQLTDFDISKDPNEWKYVERILPPKLIPAPKEFDGVAPSGWIPPRGDGKSHPYFVARNKSHMQPVYLSLSYRNSRKVTVIKRIQGDIWKLEQDLRAYLQDILKKHHKHHNLLATRVNEMSGQLRIRGDHVAHVQKWMALKGF